jgi:hypothetical protein
MAEWNQPPIMPLAARPTPWWKRLWVVGIAAALVGVGIGAAGAPGETKKVAAPTQTVTIATTSTQTTTATATPTIVKTIATRTKTHTITITAGVPIPGSKSYGSGTYVVGQQIRPGTYQTTGAELCGWATYTDLAAQDQDGFDSAQNGPLTAVVRSDDQLFKVIGDCTFRRLR